MSVEDVMSNYNLINMPKSVNLTEELGSVFTDVKQNFLKTTEINLHNCTYKLMPARGADQLKLVCFNRKRSMDAYFGLFRMLEEYKMVRPLLTSLKNGC